MKVKSKAHLTQEGINLIKELRSKLNKYSESKIDSDNACLSHETDFTTLELNKETKKKNNLKKYSSAARFVYIYRSIYIDKTTNLKYSKGPKGSRSYSTKSYCDVTSKVGMNYRFASYLAGLIEGDGSILVSGNNAKWAPYIEIAFDIKDIKLIEKIKSAPSFPWGGRFTARFARRIDIRRRLYNYKT